MAEECLKAGAESADIFAVDLSDVDALESFAQSVLKKYRKVDVLVNNAGMMPKSDGASDGTHRKTWSTRYLISLLPNLATCAGSMLSGFH